MEVSANSESTLKIINDNIANNVHLNSKNE